jgi:eukaryotic-like serine/threonine-protein kinase
MNSPADPLRQHVAERLADRYAIERELGRGGMATVYLATDLRHHRSVALKVLQPELAASLGTQRFLREIEVAAALTHPHIVPLHDSGETGEFLFYVMPFIEGESLRERLTRDGALPAADAIRIAREVAEALEYAHAHGVVHRDIKPENILLSSGHAVVSDFGIARAIGVAGGGQITEVGSAVGSPKYMSPEQVEGNPELDGRSDIYSLGCVLYEAVTGTTPFGGTTSVGMMVRRLMDTPPPMRSIRPEVTAGLEAVVKKAMARAPTERFATAAELAIALGALEAGTSGSVAVAAREEKASLAVLPFVNLSPDPENEYFSDGMTDELMSALAKLPGLRVAARTSSFAFKGKERDIRDIGQRLRVGTVLEGSVRKAGHRLRISAQLVDTGDGFQLWSETYERDLKDVFAVQDEIARTIATELKLKLLAGSEAALVRPVTSNLEAYTCYLQGRYFTQTRTPKGLKRGVTYFEQAIALDPSYARAYAGLAECWTLLGFVEFGDLPARDTLPKARAAAAKTLELDPTLGEAHIIRGIIAMIYEWEWDRAERELRHGLELKPDSPLGHTWYAIFLSSQGRFEQGIQQARIGEALDPLSLSIHLVVGRCLYWARRFDEALASMLATLEMDPGNALTQIWLARTYLAVGRPGEAVVILERGGETAGRSPYLLSLLGGAYAALGRREEALRLLAEIRGQGGSALFQAGLLSELGEAEASLDCFEEALKSEGGTAFVFGVDPLYDRLRDHPRFQAILATVGLTHIALPAGAGQPGAKPTTSAPP